MSRCRTKRKRECEPRRSASFATSTTCSRCTPLSKTPQRMTRQWIAFFNHAKCERLSANFTLTVLAAKTSLKVIWAVLRKLSIRYWASFTAKLLTPTIFRTTARQARESHAGRSRIVSTTWAALLRVPATLSLAFRQSTPLVATTVNT